MVTETMESGTADKRRQLYSFLSFWLCLRKGSPGSRLRISLQALRVITVVCYSLPQSDHIQGARQLCEAPDLLFHLLHPLPNPNTCKLSDRKNLSVHPMVAQTKQIDILTTKAFISCVNLVNLFNLPKFSFS